MVLRELLGLADLFGAQAFYIHEMTEVILVRKDKNLMLKIFHVVPPGLESLDDSQKLAVMGLIACLYRNYFPRKECYWVPLA